MAGYICVFGHTEQCHRPHPLTFWPLAIFPELGVTLVARGGSAFRTSCAHVGFSRTPGLERRDTGLTFVVGCRSVETTHVTCRRDGTFLGSLVVGRVSKVVERVSFRIETDKMQPGTQPLDSVASHCVRVT